MTDKDIALERHTYYLAQFKLTNPRKYLPPTNKEWADYTHGLRVMACRNALLTRKALHSCK